MEPMYLRVDQEFLLGRSQEKHEAEKEWEHSSEGLLLVN